MVWWASKGQDSGVEPFKPAPKFQAPGDGRAASGHVSGRQSAATDAGDTISRLRALLDEQRRAGLRGGAYCAAADAQNASIGDDDDGEDFEGSDEEPSHSTDDEAQNASKLFTGARPSMGQVAEQAVPPAEHTKVETGRGRVFATLGIGEDGGSTHWVRANSPTTLALGEEGGT